MAEVYSRTTSVIAAIAPHRVFVQHNYRMTQSFWLILGYFSSHFSCSPKAYFVYNNKTACNRSVTNPDDDRHQLPQVFHFHSLLRPRCLLPSLTGYLMRMLRMQCRTQKLLPKMKAAVALNMRAKVTGSDTLQKMAVWRFKEEV